MRCHYEKEVIKISGGTTAKRKSSFSVSTVQTRQNLQPVFDPSAAPSCCCWLAKMCLTIRLAALNNHGPRRQHVWRTQPSKCSAERRRGHAATEELTFSSQIGSIPSGSHTDSTSSTLLFESHARRRESVDRKYLTMKSLLTAERSMRKRSFSRGRIKKIK